MKPLFLIFLGFLLINQQTFCQENKNNLTKISINFDEIGEAKMSDIFSGIQYIPLETKSECLIGYMDIVSFDNEVIIRSHGNNSIYRFTDQGKFINKIGNQGRGPAEYQDYSDVRLYNDTVFVSSLFSGSVLSYTLNGKFLERYELGTGAQPKSMIQLHDKSFMIVSNNQGGIVNLFKTDNWFNIKERSSISVPLKGNPLPYGFQQSANKSYFYYNFSDTIYYVSEENLTPKFIMDFSKYKTGKEKLSMDAKESIMLNKPSLSSFYAGNDYLKFEISYPYKKSTYALLYRISDAKQSSWSNLINDLDNGILGTYNRLFDNEIVYVLLPTEILEHFESMSEKEKSDPKNSGFVQMASNLSIDSNPVLMICKLK